MIAKDSIDTGLNPLSFVFNWGSWQGGGAKGLKRFYMRSLSSRSIYPVIEGSQQEHDHDVEIMLN